MKKVRYIPIASIVAIIFLIILCLILSIVPSGNEVTSAANPSQPAHLEALLIVAIAIFYLIITIPISVVIDLIVYRIRKAKAKKHNAIIERNKSIENRTWDFPDLEFYNACVANNITDISDEYHTLKAKIFAENLLTKRRIPKTYFPLLTEETYLKERFEKGKQKFIENKNIAKKQQEEANRKQQEVDRQAIAKKQNAVTRVIKAKKQNLGFP